MGSKVELGDVRGLLMDADKRPVLRLLPQMDSVSRGYAIAHLGDDGCSLEDIASQVWTLNATDWLRGQDEFSWSLYKTLAYSGFDRALHEFAMKVAEDFLRDRKKQGQKVSKESWELLHLKRRWLDGEVSDEELKDSRDVYRDSYTDVEVVAYWAASRIADWAASFAAYWAAVRAIDWATVRAADGAAVQKGQMDLLGDMLEDSVGIQRGVEEKSLESKVIEGGE